MHTIEHKKFVLKLLEPGLISLEILPRETIEAEDIHDLYEGYEKMVGDEEYVVAVYGNPFSSISSEAREIAAKEYANPKRKKVAMITDNLAHVMVVSFYISFNKPKTHIKIFKNEQSAFKWLRG